MKLQDISAESWIETLRNTEDEGCWELADVIESAVKVQTHENDDFYKRMKKIWDE